MRNRKLKQSRLKRVNRTQILFNDRELRAIDTYCQRFKVSNRSEFMRTAIISTVLKKFDDHLPSLFEDDHPTLFSGTK